MAILTLLVCSKGKSPKFWPKVTHPSDLSVGDIRSQIAAEWLQITQRSQWRAYRKLVIHLLGLPFSKFSHLVAQESPADAVKPARRKSMPKLLQFDVFRFISPNSISPNCQFIASRGRPMLSQALGLYSCSQFEIRCLPIIKFLVQIAST